MMLCGRFVFAMTTAPSFSRVLTIAALELAGAKARPT